MQCKAAGRACGSTGGRGGARRTRWCSARQAPARRPRAVPLEPPRDRVPGPQSRAAHLRRTHVKAAAFPLFLVCVSTCFGYNSFMLTVRAAPPTARARRKTTASHRPVLHSYQ